MRWVGGQFIYSWIWQHRSSWSRSFWAWAVDDLIITSEVQETPDHFTFRFSKSWELREAVTWCISSLKNLKSKMLQKTNLSTNMLSQVDDSTCALMTGQRQNHVLYMYHVLGECSTLDTIIFRLCTWGIYGMPESTLFRSVFSSLDIPLCRRKYSQVGNPPKSGVCF